MAAPPLSTFSFSFLLITAVFSIATFPTSTLSASARCNPDDKKALLRIKKSLNNPYHLASWDPQTDCCRWYCLQCDAATGRVVELTIFSGNISGQIPPAVGDLPFLRNIVFHKLTNLTGSIPPAIAKLSDLRSLTLSWTNLSGAVPPFLAALKSLTILDLSFNDLSGAIPPELAELPNLAALHLDRNRLTGAIPESFGDFGPSVPDLYLSHNRLSGKIPRSLEKLNFETIDLSRNRLEGDATPLFGRKRAARWIDLSRNLLEFDLTKVEFPENLTSLDLSHNRIGGGLPAAMAELELQFLNVSYNRLCGPIPTGGGGRLQRFDSYSYFHNRCLCGAPLASCK